MLWALGVESSLVPTPQGLAPSPAEPEELGPRLPASWVEPLPLLLKWLGFHPGGWCLTPQCPRALSTVLGQDLVLSISQLVFDLT